MLDRRTWIGVLAACAVAFAGASVLPAEAQQPTQTIRAAVIRVDVPGRRPTSRLQLPPDDLGFAGAILGTEDNATTGRFMGQAYETETVRATPETLEAEIGRLLAAGVPYLVTLADAETTLRIADRAAGKATVFNAAATADSLRNADCRANLMHVAPSDAMLTDAVAQFLAWKRWTDWFLIEGSHPADQALAASWRRAAAKFGARIVAERVFEDTGGARRTDSGTVQIQAQMPVFTQEAPAHDIVIAADAAGVFADWLPFHTWEPRPVAGSAGLIPRSWHPAHEAWGASQWQSRFERSAGRTARDEDYQVWAALRSLGEAATRTKTDDPAALMAYKIGRAHV